MVDMGVMHELRSYVSRRIQSIPIQSGVMYMGNKKIVTSLLTIPQLTVQFSYSKDMIMTIKI